MTSLPIITPLSVLADTTRPVGSLGMGVVRVPLATEAVRLGDDATPALSLTTAMADTLSPLVRADGSPQPAGSVVLVAAPPPVAYLHGFALEMPADVSFTITTAPVLRAWAIFAPRARSDAGQVQLARRPIAPLRFPAPDPADPALDTFTGPTGAHTTFGADGNDASARRWWTGLLREPVDLRGARTIAVGVQTALAASAGANGMRLWAILGD